ncbi:MAG: LysR family transcriptional regulator [Defluviitaleaceae bacterium]|nr:LysR family transcriptional regulator [Defluviitaleaceae bacterium]
MNTRQLETFLSASITLNLTETSKRLNFTQSSITAHIKRLEEELGYDLFERLGKRIILTEKGEMFRKKAIELLKLMNESKEIGKAQHLMKIGAQESQCIYRIPSILSRHKNLYPHIKMSFRPAHSNYEVEKKILDSHLDIGFITDFKVDSIKLTCHKLIDEKILLLCSSENALAKHKRIMISDLKHETFLFTEKDCSYRNMFEALLQKEGVYQPNIIEFTSIEAIKQCVKLNIGITVLPELTVTQELKNDELIAISTVKKFPVASTYLVYHKNKQLLEHEKSFVDLAIDYYLNNKSNEL